MVSCIGGIIENSMHKLIIFVAAAVVFLWYATSVFDETFGEDRERTASSASQH